MNNPQYKVLRSELLINKKGGLRMGRLCKVFTFTILLALSLSVTGGNTCSAAITAEGNYCWNIKILEDESGSITPETYLMKLHIVPIGNKTTAIIRGSVVVSDDYSPIITGVASITSTTISANINATQRHKNNSWNDTSIAQITINQSTLNGTIFEIGYDFDRSSRKFDDRYMKGQLIYVKCP